MIATGQAAVSRSARIRAELARRGQVETRVEHTRQIDMSLADRERISQLEGEVAELAHQLHQLTASPAPVALVPQDEGNLEARVRQLEDLVQSIPELSQTILEFGQTTMHLADRDQVTAQQVADLQGRLEYLRGDVASAIDDTVRTIQALSGGK